MSHLDGITSTGMSLFGGRTDYEPPLLEAVALMELGGEA